MIVAGMSSSRPSSIADRIRWILVSTGITQRELARASGLADTQISLILKRLDERPYAIELDTIIRIARGAGVTPRWLLLGEGQPYSDQPQIEVPYVPLRAFPDWPVFVAEMHLTSSPEIERLLEWVGEVALPLDGAHPLTLELAECLARYRMRLLYGGMFEPRLGSNQSAERAALPASARTPAKKPRRARPASVLIERKQLAKPRAKKR